MGVISINSAGSFSVRAHKNFSALDHGHTRAVRDAIMYLADVMLPAAIKQDSKLRAEGCLPRKGFQRRDEKWLDAVDKKPGEQIPMIEETARSLAPLLQMNFPPGWVWTLFAFSVGEKGAMSYISNGEREDMVAGIEEWLEKIKQGYNGTVGEEITD